jgi:outer membrane receptor protein involved in Fe transport
MTNRQIPFKHRAVLGIIVLVLAWQGLAQESGTDVSKLTKEQIAQMGYAKLVNLPLEDLMQLADKMGVSVDELLSMKVSVSSKKSLNTRESPGIISVITDEEIANSGARNLMDVLRLVPGFEFGYDIDGAIGVAMRGIWGHEGKVLLQIDGQEMNELLYSTLQFGNHYPIDNIKRIEILRGPGSCVYGGFAELGVINIITKKSDDLKGVAGKLTLGTMQRDYGRANLSLGVGKFFDGFDFSLTGNGGLANRTDRTYIDGGGFEYGPDSKIAQERSGNANLNVNIKDLSLRAIFDYYGTNTADAWDSQPGVTNDFYSVLGEARYEINPNQKLTITPKLNYKYQIPYQYLDERSYYDMAAARYTGNVTASYDATEKINILGGAEVYMDQA